MKEQEKMPLTETDKPLVKAEKSVKQYRLFLFRLAVLLIGLWLLFFFIIGVGKMPSDDMFPKIEAGNTLIFFRLDKTPKKGDVMIYEKEVKGELETFISRVVATEGDMVEITKDNRVIINGNALRENDIFYETPDPGKIEYPVTLGKGEYFALADYREKGMDSRYFGAVTKKDTVGTVIITINRNNM